MFGQKWRKIDLIMLSPEVNGHVITDRSVYIIVVTGDDEVVITNQSEFLQSSSLYISNKVGK